MKQDAAAQIETVGDAIAGHLADIGVATIFGVISIHNMPIIDAIARQGRIRFVPARGEAGAMNMADAYARVSRGLGVVLTSTGTAAGNAAGAQVEALTAGSPVLHITTQVDREFMDRDRAAIHDVPKQADMLKAISKSYFRLWEPAAVHSVLSAAASAALSAPSGPVSLEIPVDVQRLKVPRAAPQSVPALASIHAPQSEIERLSAIVKAAKRPVLWLGGGANKAKAQANELVERGFCAVTSTNGRASVDEDHPATLGAFNMTPEAMALYEAADLMIVVGSRLRGNETRDNRMALPAPLVQIDCDAAQGGRNYAVDSFIHGDATDTLQRLLDCLPKSLEVDEAFRHEFAIARVKGEGRLRDVLGPYRVIADVLQQRVAAGRHPFVRDVTIANSTFGNRYVQIAEPHHGVHALGGGIGQGLAMGIGAGLVEGENKVVGLVGDGGAQLGLAELITAVEEKADIVYILMNDEAYGVIENIQDAQYDGRRVYSALKTPDFGSLCTAVGLTHEKIGDVADFETALDGALERSGPVLIEIDMKAIGPFGEAFGGPPAGAAGRAT
ncbi:MAG: thiamine pyrophosphate-binding protein [Alphaproteobacteria bacterium]|nr:thiamine pyrophosphate-binding protein [Alphaproteobacteria bacterium]